MSEAAAERTENGRIVAIDLARFVALAGMFAAHTWNRNESGTTTLIGDLVAGRAAALFAVVAGIGIAFVTRRLLHDGQAGRARLMLLGRGAALLVIGLSLGLLSTNVFVIIAYYGVLFWVMAAFITLRTSVLILTAALAAIAGPVLNIAAREALGSDYEVGTPAWPNLLDPLALVRALTLTGIYPAITWLVYGIAGLLIGRALLRARGAAERRSLGLRVLLIGATATALGFAISGLALEVFGGRDALAALYPGGGDLFVDQLLSGSGVGTPRAGSPWWFFAATPHTGTLPDLLITGGISAVVIGSLLAALPSPSRSVRRILLPLWGAGAIPLTAYSVHVTLTAIVPEIAALLSPTGEVPTDLDSGPALWSAHVLIALALGTVLALLKVRGPFETVVTLAGQVAAGRSAAVRSTSGSR